MSAATTPPGSSFGAREREELLVVVLLGVEEDDVEDVLDRGQRLVSVALDELGPVAEPGLGDVRPPRLALRRVVLERDDAPAENPRGSGEPDRRVAAGAADLEHLAGVLRRDEREQEPASRRRDRARAHRRRQAELALGRVLRLEAVEDRSYALSSMTAA